MTVPTPSGWYPDPSGQPAQRYCDGRQWTQWTEHQDPPAPQSATAGAPRVLLALIVGAGMAVVAAVALLFFFVSAEVYYSYSAGTPTTATVTDCGKSDRSGCEATWSIGGVPGYGKISGGLFDGTDRVGSTHDVRVHGRTAYTPNSWTTPSVIGGCVLVGGLFVVFVVAFVVIRPRLTRR
jgi:Protein of unknown function (DUF2510)